MAGFGDGFACMHAGSASLARCCLWYITASLLARRIPPSYFLLSASLLLFGLDSFFSLFFSTSLLNAPWTTFCYSPRLPLKRLSILNPFRYYTQMRQVGWEIGFFSYFGWASLWTDRGLLGDRHSIMFLTLLCVLYCHENDVYGPRKTQKPEILFLFTSYLYLRNLFCGALRYPSTNSLHTPCPPPLPSPSNV